MRLSRRRFLKFTGLTAASVLTGSLVEACRRGPTQALPTLSPEDMTATVEAQGVTVSTPIAGKTNVTWWTHNNPTFVEANKEMIRRFEAANPEIHIVYQYFPYGVFINKLQAGYRAGTVADMQQMFGTWVTEYAKNGLLDPVPDTLAASLEERFWPAALGAYKYQGTYYGLPNEYNLENGGMLVNPKLLQEAGYSEPPTTWEQLIEYAQKLTKRDEQGNLQQVGFAFTNPDSPTFLLLELILEQGGTYWAADGVHVDFSTDAAKTAWQVETELITKYKVDMPGAYTGDSYEVFFRGQAAMAMRGPWAISAGKEEFPEFDFIYAEIPPYRKPRKFAAESGWGEVVNAKADPKVKEAAWKFIEFMHHDENMRDWNTITFTIPSLKPLQNDAQILAKAPELKVAFDVIPAGQWVGPVQNRDRFWQTISDALTAVALGQMSAADALRDAEQKINAMIDEYVGP